MTDEPAPPSRRISLDDNQPKREVTPRDLGRTRRCRNCGVGMYHPEHAGRVCDVQPPGREACGCDSYELLVLDPSSGPPA